MTGLAAERRGESGPPIVMVHGSLSSAAAAFAGQKALAGRFRIIAPYRRGCQPSPPAARIDPGPRRRRRSRTPRRRRAPARHVDGRMRAAALAPDKVWSLTVAEPPALPNGSGRRGADRLAALRDYWAADPATFVAGFLRVLNVELPLPPPLLEAARNLMTERPWETGVPAEALARTSFPKLVVTGGGTPGFEDVADALAETLSAKRVLFPGSPHAVQRFNDEFLAHLGG
ncbi:alpha/beta fold hydrolase [Amycolatopsis sp. VS8301801F10]|uniref:alpha/beta fold hydrolase n=1 Tax=Amycolatopsis sp. VS8301801F10 TaxID=2652442 RepID=UPI0038FC0E80